MKLSNLFLSLVVAASIGACGGGSGSDSGPAISAQLRQEGPFQAGGTVPFVVSTENFTLAPPFNMRAKIASRHDAMDHVEGDMGMNPEATEGHYHVYLNDGSGTDPHLTAWSTEGDFQLPEQVESGTHSLRFELRDNNHVVVGAETVLFFDVE